MSVIDLRLILQVQFLLVIVITVYNLSSGCGYDIRVQWTALIYLSSLFLLFLNFYHKSYTTRPAVAEKKEHISTAAGNGDARISTRGGRESILSS